MPNIFDKLISVVFGTGASTVVASAGVGGERATSVPAFDADVDNHIYTEPDTWGVDSTYTPSDVSSAISSADGGILESAADICEAQWKDDRIRGTLQTRVEALLGLNNEEKLEFEAENETVRAAAQNDWYLSAPETELFKLVRWGLHLGIGFAQRKVVRIKIGRAERWIPRLETWHPRHFTWDHARGIWTGYGVDRSTGESVQFDIFLDDPHWITFCPYGEIRPWAEGTWLACALLWLVKTRGLRSWAKHNDLHGSGALVGKASAGASPDDRKRFWAQLKTMARNARIVLPEGYELDVLEAQAKTWETYDKIGMKADTGIAIVHLGQPMTTETPKGAETGSENARAVRQDYLEADAERLATWGHDKHFPAWAVWNFGNANLSPWPKYNAAPPPDLMLEATRLAALVGAIAELDTNPPDGFRLDKETLWRRHHIPMIEGSPPKPKALPE